MEILPGSYREETGMGATPDQERVRFIVVDEDIRAFCRGGSAIMRPYFAPEFVDYDARGHCDFTKWRVRFTSADDYLQAFDKWSQGMAGRELKGYASPEDWVREATILTAEDVKIKGDCAMAPKRFLGQAVDADSGEKLSWNKTVIYLMRKQGDDWKVTGMISNLPGLEQA